MATIGLSGCVLPELDYEDLDCPCIEGYECVADFCVPVGSVVRDAGPADAANLDAELPADSGPDDTGVIPDTGGPDAQFPDADVGPQDTGADAGAMDTGPTDTGFGDTGPMDTGPADTGPADTGTMPVACRTDRQCTSPSTICSAGFCSSGCDSGGPICAMGLACDPTTGHCFNAGSGCTQDSQCGGGPPEGVCLSGRCEYGCLVDTQACRGDRLCEASGFCSVSANCQADTDCARSDFVCQANTCVRRCDEPDAFPCFGNSSCSAASGKCEGATALGLDCVADANCISGQCSTFNGQRFCTRGCGATQDCPLDMTCLSVSGAKLCVRENVFSPRPQLDTVSGRACTNPGNICQSQLCLNNICTERCTQDEDCRAYGTPCVTLTLGGQAGTTYIQQCGAPVGAVPSGDVCSNNDNTQCETGVCNRYTDQCAGGCCADADCDASESCLVYDLAGDSPQTSCQPRSGAGTGGFGQTCSTASTCASDNCAPRDPANLGGAKSCTTHCCSDLDCTDYPGGGRCVAMPAIGVAAVIKYCVPLVP